MAISRCTKLRTTKVLKKPKRGEDGFGTKTSAHLDYRNGLLARLAKAVGGRVLVLESPAMGSLRRLLAEGVEASRVHVINKSAARRFRQKARALGATPHVCMFHELPERLPEGADVVYYDGTRGNPANAYQDLRPLLELGPARPKALMVTIAKRASTFVPQTTRVCSLLRWLASLGYQPVGGWKRAEEAVSSGKVYCLAVHRLGRDGPGAGLLQTPPDFRLRAGGSKRRLGLEELRDRLQRLAAEPRPPRMSSHDFPVVGRAEALRDAVEHSAPDARRLASLRPHGPSWFWENFDAWRQKAAGSQSRIRNLPPTKKRAIFLAHFEALAAALPRAFEDARRALLLLRHCSAEQARQLRCWAESTLKPGTIVGEYDALQVDFALAPLLSAGSYEELLAGVEAVQNALKPGGTLLVTLRAPHDATGLLWALRLEAHLCAQGCRPLPGFDPRMLADVSELATVSVRRP